MSITKGYGEYKMPILKLTFCQSVCVSATASDKEGRRCDDAPVGDDKCLGGLIRAISSSVMN
jgi:hypothetical protein